ncbi:hypothetical protein L1D24_12145 [Vibrio brasiliensis]|uniref:hypothetical protein n=1 Tax=Vibrio brasiliensis TaxID=170652 RepID=UPI001EFD23AC|nr:hypothetical protein [Vibrio brasiliensis]MCG9649316.1 hypothetical protein [Vibrio brasiliensis]
MKSKLITLAIVLSSVALAYFTYKLGMTISYKKQAGLISEIRNVSSIIFGVTGAWLALVYPKALASADLALRAANDAVYEQAEHDNNVLLEFIRTIIASIVIIALSIAIPFVKEVMTQFAFFMEYRSYLLGTLFLLISILGLVQLYLLFATLKQTKSALKDVKKKIAHAKTMNARSHNQNH